MSNWFSDTRKALILTGKNTYKRAIVFDDNLVAIELYKTRVCLNKPLYAGQAILDLSKLYMYRFHYDFIHSKYDKYHLLFTDTDSFCYHIETDNIYKDMAAHSDMYDFSNYDQSHSLFSNKNKKVIGKFKDECAGDPAIEFVGLRPKCYSILSTKDTKQAMKGVSYAAAKKFSHEDYRECLFFKEIHKVDVNMIRNNVSVLMSITQNKVALSPFDDKRYILSDGITTLAYGHKDIPCNE